MKLKIYVIDLEIPARVKAWMLRIGILTVLLGTAALALAADPWHVWVTGETLTPGDLNGNFMNLQNQITALQTSVTALQGKASGPVSVGAYIVDSTAGASIGYQSSTWIQSVSRTGVGAVTITLVPSFFSSNPPCTVTPNSTFALTLLPSVVTNTILVSLQSSNGAAVDSNFMIVCSQTRS